jgi:DNA-binding transcriptional ArsR family regulator
MNAPNLLPILADPVRLTLVSTLKSGERTVGELTRAAGIAQSGVSRHLAILHKAGIVTVRAEAQRRLYALRPEPFLELEGWLAEFHSLWSARLDRFAGALTERQMAARQLEAKDD